HTRRKPLGKKVNLNKLAQKTETLIGSDIEFICRKAAMLAIRGLIDRNRGNPGDITGDISILEPHFEEAIQLVLKQNATKK
ncbi:MAG: AAA family ATPase, partial [Bacteroidota bacterium]